MTNKKKITKLELAKHIGFTKDGIYKMKKNHPKKFNILWLGWEKYNEVKK